MKGRSLSNSIKHQKDTGKCQTEVERHQKTLKNSNENLKGCWIMLGKLQRTLGKCWGIAGGQENIKKMLNNVMDDWGHYRQQGKTLNNINKMLNYIMKYQGMARECNFV